LTTSRRLVPIVVLPKNTERKSHGPKTRQNDFLGNTRLGNIEGLFRRNEVSHGDEFITKQIKKDNKAKFKGRGKPPTLFSSKKKLKL